MSARIRALLSLCLVLAVAVAAAPATARHDAADVTRVADLERGVLAQINELRRSHGLRALRANAGLAAAASAHSTAMARRGFFAHESADGTEFWRRISRYYPRRRSSWSVGENLLWSSPSIDAAGSLRMWLNSPPHRKNLLSPQWREVGLSAVHAESAPGVFNGAAVTILTADFGTRR